MNNYVEMSRNAYMKWDKIKKSNHPILDSSDVFCVQGDQIIQKKNNNNKNNQHTWSLIFYGPDKELF